MADRQDIDALLIGALYGELDGDERARLDAHLASHPQDKSALEGLRSTRDLLREADLPVSLAAAEPSPAITARLLQEAARRAPAPASGGILAFLASLLRPFAASPALSAATALVLVGGSAGLLYSRGAFDLSEPTTRQAQHQVGGDTTKLAGSAPAPGGAPGVDDYRVALEDGERDNRGEGLDQLDGDKRREAQTGDEAGRATADRADRSLAAAEGASRTAGQSGAEENEVAASAKFQTATGSGSEVAVGDAVGAKADSRRPGYIELTKQSKDEPNVLALDGTTFKNEQKNVTVVPADSDGFADDGRPVAPAVAPSGVAPSGGSSGGAAVGGGGGTTDKKAPARVALAEGRAADPAAAPPPAQKGNKPIAGKPSTTQQVARDQGKAGGSSYDPAKAAALDTWARDQHARMVKLVNAGKCTDAGTVGADIARKAPDYYQSNVANDRAVRACRPYVDRARRAKAADEAKTKAASPRSPQPDSPYQSDSAESVK